MDDRLSKALKGVKAPSPGEAARTRALEAAMAAFDAAQAERAQATNKDYSRSVQGTGFGARLRSIVSDWTRNLTMDIRIPLGATMAAILVVPLGWHFLNQTALTPVDLPLVRPAQVDASPEAETVVAEPSGVAQEQSVASVPMRVDEAFANAQSRQVVVGAPPPAPMDQAFAGGAVPSAMPPSGDRFTAFAEGGARIVASEPVSTFSIDVDTASYAYVRRMLEMGSLPPANAVRVEELINYFSYDYALPEPGGHPFAPTIAVHPTPWNPHSRLVHIGIKGHDIDLSEVPAANIVLLIDTSGSMEGADRIDLLKRSLGLLVNELGAEDRVSIVTYAGSAGVALEPTPGDQKARIMAVIDSLEATGATAGSQGIQQAYALAEQARVSGGTNRVVLATDGDFNVGISDPGELESFIAQKRASGIGLSVLGFGAGNYNDEVMQTLAQAGNGNAAYIDSFSEARKVLVEELGGTLMTIASDVKVQVEFNPAAVSEYRLIGYETRALNREDFNNDAVDAGDVGAGHTVTAIYEIVPVGAQGSIDPLRYGQERPAAVPGSDAEYGFLKIRYKAPGSDVSTLIEAPIPVAGQYESLDGLPADMRFATAVAAFGQKLRGSAHLRTMDWQAIRDLAASGRGDDETGRRAEFIRLIDIAESLS